MPSKIRPPAPGGLPRERLETLLGGLDGYRLALVVAPAGSGKTTLLARTAAVAGVPVAWYRAEIWDRDEASLVEHLRLALRAAIGGLDQPVTTVDSLLAALEAWPGPRVALVIDDLHHLEGTPAEQALERLVDYGPVALTVLAGSRVQPGFNLSRLRVSGGLVEITSDDLRFRPWEVERLFRDHYLQQVPPQELAVLARRTEGWAAGLQLFHLATRNKSPDERRRILAGVASGSRLTREYLARNVLGDLSEDLRRFLVETSVLGRLSGPLCDQLLDRTNSRAVLEELERRQIFTTALDDDREYRYHEVLRAHLVAMLVEERGEAEARAHHVRAGRLLEEAGAYPEALGAYSRGEDWASVERVLGRTGESLISRPAAWLDALPTSLLRHDPWLLLASARHARDEGRWQAALDAYQRAEKAFGSADAAVACRRERMSLAAWFAPIPTPGADWSDVLRAATVRDPGAARRAAEHLPDWAAPFVTGLALLLGGSPPAAREALAAAVDDETTPPALAAAAALADGAAALLAGDGAWRERVEASVNAADRLGVRWLARLGRAALALAGGRPSSEVAAAIAACRDDGDPWGEALIGLWASWLNPDPEAAAAAAQRAGSLFRGLGAATLEAWARGRAAQGRAQAHGEDARDAALATDAFARSVAVPGPRLLAFVALQSADPARSAAYEALAQELREETGLVVPAFAAPGGSGPLAARPPDATPTAAAGVAPATARDATRVVSGAQDREPAPTRRPHASSAAAREVERLPLAITCLGGFSLRVGDRAVELAEVKPRARSLLRFLALHAGSWVHREVIAEALWPDGDRESPARSLQVGLSALRRLLERSPERAASSYLARDGDAYRLEIAPGSWIDLRELEAAIAQARQARVAGDAARARDALRRALELYRGDLLPEDGPASWVVEPRERIRAQVTQAAEWLATLALEGGDPAEATRAALAGLVIDRYSDPLWRLLIGARDVAGDHGAAERARQEYAAVLAGLGVVAEHGEAGSPETKPGHAHPADGAGNGTGHGTGPGNGHGAGYAPPSRGASSVSPLGRAP